MSLDGVHYKTTLLCRIMDHFYLSPLLDTSRCVTKNHKITIIERCRELEFPARVLKTRENNADNGQDYLHADLT